MPREIRLSTRATAEERAELCIGDVVYLDGPIYTAREGAYIRGIDQGCDLPDGLAERSLANFHCSPAARINPDGSFDVGAVTGTSSFRFGKWIGPWMRKSGARIIVGKGGMSPALYRDEFVPLGAVYLTTVGYGTGALLGRGIKGVECVHWRDELGLAQAIWVMKAEKLGPFIVDCDTSGNSLFERENARISAGLARAYEGTRPATLKRFGETDDRRDELIG